MHRYRWFLWPAISFPIAVLSHELAHYGFARVFGFRKPSLHYGSASYAGSDEFWDLVRAGDLAGAEAIYPAIKVGIAALAGILATYLVIVACVLIAHRRPHPFIVGLGLVAPLRFIGSLFVLMAMAAGREMGLGSDEAHAAAVLHLSDFILHLLGVATLVLTWIILLRAIPAEGRNRHSAQAVAGVVVGGALYIGVLGPWLLP